MTTNKKGRTDCNQATPKTFIYTANSTGLVTRIKGLIVTLALWGWFPLGLADWLTHRGGPGNE